MSDKPIRAAYLDQRAPAQALPLALQRFEQAPRDQRAYWLPPLAGALLLLVWFMAPVREVVLPGNGHGEPASSFSSAPGLGAVSLPSPPTMPRLAAMQLPRGDLAIPRINKMSLTTYPTEKN